MPRGIRQSLELNMNRLNRDGYECFEMVREEIDIDLHATGTNIDNRGPAPIDIDALGKSGKGGYQGGGKGGNKGKDGKGYQSALTTSILWFRRRQKI